MTLPHFSMLPFTCNHIETSQNNTSSISVASVNQIRKFSFCVIACVAFLVCYLLLSSSPLLPSQSFILIHTHTPNSPCLISKQAISIYSSLKHCVYISISAFSSLVCCLFLLPVLFVTLTSLTKTFKQFKKDNLSNAYK